jgi:hypothetical protein
MRRFAREHANTFLEQQKAAAGGRLSDEEAMETAVDAQRTARRKIRRAKPKPKHARKK